MVSYPPSSCLWAMQNQMVYTLGKGVAPWTWWALESPFMHAGICSGVSGSLSVCDHPVFSFTVLDQPVVVLQVAMALEVIPVWIQSCWDRWGTRPRPIQPCVQTKLAFFWTNTSIHKLYRRNRDRTSLWFPLEIFNFWGPMIGRLDLSLNADLYYVIYLKIFSMRSSHAKRHNVFMQPWSWT